MRIGLTYDLRSEYLARGYSEDETAEFDREETIAAIDAALIRLGHETDRVGNAWSLVERLAAGSRWDLVFNIAEGMIGIGREAQVPAILDAYDIPYTFSDPLVMSLTLHKGMTKRVLRDLGIPTPDFFEIQYMDDIAAVDLPFPLFAKPIAEGTGKGISAASKVIDPEQLAVVCRRLLEKYRQPALVETFLPGREFTVGIVGTGAKARSVGAMEVIFNDGSADNAYGYSCKKDWMDTIEYRRADDAEAQLAIEYALAAWRGLGCRDGGRIDLRVDAHGVPNVIELNPLAGLQPDYSDLPILCNLNGISYMQLMDMILASALERIPQGERA